MKTKDIKYPKLANFEEKKEKELGCWKNAPAFFTSQLWPWKTQAIMQPSSPRCTHGNWIWRSLSHASGTDCGTSSGRHGIRESTCCTSADRRVCTSAVQVASDSFKRSTSCKLTPRKNAKSSRREKGLGKNSQSQTQDQNPAPRHSTQTVTSKFGRLSLRPEFPLALGCRPKGSQECHGSGSLLEC